MADDDVVVLGRSCSRQFEVPQGHRENGAPKLADRNEKTFGVASAGWVSIGEVHVFSLLRFVGPEQGY